MEGVRDREYWLGVARDWGTGGLWYGWVGCMGWGKRVGQGLGYGWVRLWYKVGWGTGWGMGETRG